MSGTHKYYVEPNDANQSYDIMKRDGVENPDGTLAPERVCSIYSMEYLDAVLEALAVEDSKLPDPELPESFANPSPIREEWNE